jgi:hypothetical protein
VSIARRTKLSASQLAAIAANILDGFAYYEPTQVALSKEFGVSVLMIEFARRLSPSSRQMVISGRCKLGYYAKPKSRDDVAALRAIIRRLGVDRTVDVAAAMEAAQ